MALEDQVRRTFDTLTARLQQEVSRQVEAAVADLHGESGAAAAVPSQAGAFIHAMREIDLALSLSSVLDTLAASLNRLGIQATLLVTDGEQLRRWPMDGSTDGADEDELLASVDADLHIPLVVGGAIVGMVLVDSTCAPAALRPDRAELVEAITRYSSERLTSITALRSAQLYANRDEQGDGWQSLRLRHARNMERLNEQESARRYARLLVSEIKLYHESDVIAGRRERDLSSRLAPEIVRARALYEARVPADARRATDFFHAELVRTLANGDPALLGHAADSVV